MVKWKKTDIRCTWQCQWRLNPKWRCKWRKCQSWSRWTFVSCYWSVRFDGELDDDTIPTNFPSCRLYDDRSCSCGHRRLSMPSLRTSNPIYNFNFSWFKHEIDEIFIQFHQISSISNDLIDQIEWNQRISFRFSFKIISISICSSFEWIETISVLNQTNWIELNKNEYILKSTARWNPIYQIILISNFNFFKFRWIEIIWILCQF